MLTKKQVQGAMELVGGWQWFTELVPKPNILEYETVAEFLQWEVPWGRLEVEDFAYWASVYVRLANFALVLDAPSPELPRKYAAIDLNAVLEAQPDTPELEPRKIVQLLTAGDEELTALCNDGTVWSIQREWAEWSQLVAIPQPGEESSDEEC